MGNGDLVWDAMGGLFERPETGFVVDIEWAAADRSYAQWYETESAGQQRLDELVQGHHGHREGPRVVDLTAPGCNPSRATLRAASDFLAEVSR